MAENLHYQSTETTSGTTYYIECSTSGMNFPDSDFTLSIQRIIQQIYILTFQRCRGIL